MAVTGAIQIRPNSTLDFLDLQFPTLVPTRPQVGDEVTLRVINITDDPTRVGDVAVSIVLENTPTGTVGPIPVGTFDPDALVGEPTYTIPDEVADFLPIIPDGLVARVFASYFTITGGTTPTTNEFDAGSLFFDDGDAVFALVQNGPADGGSIEVVLAVTDPDDGIADPPSPTFAWFLDGVASNRSTTSSFPLSAGDVNDPIAVEVSYQDGHGFDELVEVGPLTVEAQPPVLPPTSGPILETAPGFSKGGTYVFETIRDFDGILHGGFGPSVADGYTFQGASAPFNSIPLLGIFTNQESGRFATAAIDPVSGSIDFNDFGANGATRVAGIYDDPNQGTVFDSQTRLTNDLLNENLSLEAFGDFDGDGDTDLYWRTLDGTAFLRLILHADGNTQYANYQNFDQMSNTLNDLGLGALIPEIIA